METLAQYLAAEKITQVQFAQRIGVTQPVVSRLLNGRAQPSPDLARRIQDETAGRVPFHAWPAYSAFGAAS